MINDRFDEKTLVLIETYKMFLLKMMTYCMLSAVQMCDPGNHGVFGRSTTSLPDGGTR